MSLWVAALLGIVEGLTEFLPVSSTGHLILTARLAGLEEGPRSEVFEIFIQLGAVLAVVVEYRTRLMTAAMGLSGSARERGFVLKLGLAFVPAAVLGLLAHDAITEHLFSPRTVAFALIAGAVLIFVVEALPLPRRTYSTDEVTWGQALLIGCAQCLSLWPGFSRSAATILGAMTVGLDRRAATEFSFLLAIPTLGAATVYSLVKGLSALEPGDTAPLAVAFVVSFLVAWASIRWLLRFVATHSLRPFAWYRLALGAIVLWWMGT